MKEQSIDSGEKWHKKIDLRTFPKLRFHWDPTFERADRIESLFAEIEKEQNANRDPEQDDPTEEETQLGN